MSYRFPLGATLSPVSVERWMDQVLGNLPSASLTLRADRRRAVAVDLWADEQSLHAELEVPGLRSEELEVEVHDGVLSLRGRPTTHVETSADDESKPAEPARQWFRRERAALAFERRFELPFDVDVEHVEATLEHGVLHVRLPKAEKSKPRKISVRQEDRPGA